MMSLAKVGKQFWSLLTRHVLTQIEKRTTDLIGLCHAVLVSAEMMTVRRVIFSVGHRPLSQQSFRSLTVNGSTHLVSLSILHFGLHLTF